MDDEEDTADRGDGRRREGPHQGGFSLELLPFWKSREVFSTSRTISISVLGTMIRRDRGADHLL